MSRTRTASMKGGTLRLVIAFAALTMLMAIPSIAAAQPMRLFIDPGHGGHDPGAVGHGLMEKNSNLSIAKMVAESARRQGWQVKMSRTGDYFVPLNTRSRMANRWKATVFVSIHGNSTGNHKAGYMTIYRSPAGRTLGKRIMSRTNRLTPYKDIGNRRDVRGLAVLRGARQPAVLVEAMSLTAKAEWWKLRRPEQRRIIAEEIVHGIAQYRGVKYVAPPVEKKAEATADSTTTQKTEAAAKTRNSNPPIVRVAPEPKNTPVTAPWAGGRSNVAAVVPLAAGSPKPAAGDGEKTPARVQKRPAASPNWFEALIAFLGS